MGHRILVVDDSRVALEAIRFALGPLGCELVAVTEVPEAMDLLEPGDVDLVVTDLVMPGGGGWELIEYTRLNHPVIPVIVLTAISEVETAVSLMRAGAYDVLTKPFRPAEFRARIRRGLEYGSLLRERRRLESENQAYKKDLEYKLDDQTRIISSMLRLSSELNRIRDVETALNLVVRTVGDLFGASKVSVLVRKLNGTIEIESSERGDPSLDRASALLAEEAMDTGRFAYHVLEGMGAARRSAAFASVPLLHDRDQEGRVLGVINVASTEGRPFTQEELRVMQAVADATSVALANMESRRRVEQAYYDTVQALALALEAKDAYTRGHSQRVTHLSVAIAEEMELDRTVSEQIRLAGLLHDVGKIGIPEKIINKPARLTVEEYRAIMEHSTIGENMVKHISFLDEARKMIRHHHERFDGRGYPDSLRGDEIEIGSRIMAVADAFDAMRTDRPYRRALTKEAAIAELKRYEGIQFDPRCVDAFLACVDEVDPQLYSGAGDMVWEL